MKLFFSSFSHRTLRPAAVIFSLLGVSTSVFAARWEGQSVAIFRAGEVDFSVLSYVESCWCPLAVHHDYHVERHRWSFGTASEGRA